jgi:aerobic-type carbon monoxide dehydrogenase small subunit (CoxS/CutS family)
LYSVTFNNDPEQDRQALDGEPITAFAGETVAAALFAASRRTLRITAVAGTPRGVFCGMGVCYDCLVVIDGEPSRRACLTFAAEGMRVETQHGFGDPA